VYSAESFVRLIVLIEVNTTKNMKPTLKSSPTVNLDVSKFKETPLVQNNLSVNDYFGVNANLHAFSTSALMKTSVQVHALAEVAKPLLIS
jgi:hypothetical protein